MLKRKLNSYQSLDGMEIIWLKNLKTWNGGKERPSIKLLINLNHQRDQLNPHLDFLFKISTKSLVLEQFQSEELKPVSSNQEWLSNSPHQPKPLKSNLLKCIMNNLLKLPQVIMLDSMSKVLPSKILKEVMLLLIPTTNQPLKLLDSKPKLLFLVILVKLEMVTLQFLIATQLISLVNLIKLSKKSIKDPSKFSKKTQLSSKLVTVVWSKLYQLNHFVLNHIKNTLHLEDSPSETWKRLLL